MIKKIFNLKGFTLIELIIVFTIIAILSASGFAAFVLYSQTQSLSNDRENVVSILNLAKANTVSQFKPTSATKCQGTLEGYSVVFTTSGANVNTYQLYVRCSGNNPGSTPPREVKMNDNVYKLSSNITFLTTGGSPMNVSSVFYPLLTGGIEVKNLSGNTANCSNYSCRIVLSGYGRDPKIITIDSSGSIK